MRCVVFVFLLCEILLNTNVVFSSDDSFYDILGVDSAASARTIKQAYKQLAKEWHPDKNKSPDANERFMKINEAYETLSDPQKRQHYDLFGSNSAQERSEHRGNPFDGFSFHFDRGGPFQFHFSGSSNMFSKYKINLWTYQNMMLSESQRRPFLVYVYSDFCFRCMQTSQVWSSFVEDLEKIGAGIAVVNSDSSPALIRKLRVKTIPEVVALVKGKLVHYSGTFAIKELREFVRGLLSSNSVVMLTDDSFDSFVSDWSANKVKVIMFDSRKQPCLRFLMAAFAHREHFKSGYYHLGSSTTRNSMIKKYNLNHREENFIIIKEDGNEPVVQVAGDQVSRGLMDQLMEQHKYLFLPRVSSPNLFEHLCPLSPRMKPKRICVLLVAQGLGQEEAKFLDSFRTSTQLLKNSSPSRYDGVSFGYLDENSQRAFVGALVDDNKNNHSNDCRKVVIIWKNSRDGLTYKYLEGGWTVEHADDDILRLTNFLESCLSRGQSFGHDVIGVPEIVDEFAESIFWSYLSILFEHLEQFLDLILQDELMFTMLFMALLVIFFTLFLIKAMSPKLPTPNQARNSNADRESRARPASTPTGSTREEEDFDLSGSDETTSERSYTGARLRRTESSGESSNSRGRQAGTSNQEAGRHSTRTSLAIIELEKSSYDRLVLMGDRGWRTIVVLVNEEGGKRAERVMEKFSRTIRSYTSSHFRFRFAYLNLTSLHLYWCRQVARASLMEALSEPERTSISYLLGANKDLLEGMVLAINSTGRYYHLFLNAGNLPGKDQNEEGDTVSFLGLDDDEELADDIRFDWASRGVERGRPVILDGFDAWLDRLYEGTLPKIHVSTWPVQLT